MWARLADLMHPSLVAAVVLLQGGWVSICWYGRRKGCCPCPTHTILLG